jgi:hypothetical protein
MKTSTPIGRADTAEQSGEPALLDRPQLAAKLNVTPRTIATWDAQGRLPRITIGRTVRYHLGDVLDWLRKTSFSPTR